MQIRSDQETGVETVAQPFQKELLKLLERDSKHTKMILISNPTGCEDVYKTYTSQH